MTAAGEVYLERLLSQHSPATLMHRLAKTKLDALTGDTTSVAFALKDLLHQTANRPEPFTVFQFLAHSALLTGQLELTSRLINQRFGTGSWGEGGRTGPNGAPNLTDSVSKK